MSDIRSFLKTLVPMTLVSLGACTTADSNADDSHALGIAQFETVENGNTTSIIGLDATGFEVGRVEIFHGIYGASPEFAVDFSSPTVDGRTLSVKVGTQTYHWETEGYAPTMSLPAAPPKMIALGSFLEAPEVVDVMKHWGIGFEHFVAANDAPTLGNEDPYVLYCGDGTKAGNSWSSVTSDSGTGGTLYSSVTSVSLPNGETANTCGGSVAAESLGLITTTINSVSQYAITQKCTLNGSTNLWRKTCPAGTGTASQCGTTTGACVGCGTYGYALGYTNVSTYSTETVTDLQVLVTTSTVNGRQTIQTTCN